MRIQILHILIYILCLSTVSLSNSEADTQISFIYSFLTRKDFKSDIEIIEKDTTQIQSGDQLRINLGYRSDSFLYLLYLDSANNYYFLYPDNSIKKTFVGDTTFVTPVNWFELDNNTGYESFYFINSKNKLDKFEKLIGTHSNAPLKLKNKISIRIKNMLTEFFNTAKNEQLTNLNTRLSKPILGGVAFRAADEDINQSSITHTESGNNLAIKRLVLDHR